MSLRNPGSFPAAIPHAADYEFEPISIGKSACAVYRLSSPGRPALFLKVAAGADLPDLESEHERLVWLWSRASVPMVVDFVVERQQAFLLTMSLPGANAAESPEEYWPQIVVQLAGALRYLHSLDPMQCPFDRGPRCVLPTARKRATAGLVDESDFDEERLGRAAIDLLGQLDRDRPESEELVVTHGDACLSNAIFCHDRFSGFVDCSRCGRADRYQDLALASRSIENNFGQSFVAEFFKAHGVTDVDQARLSYYRLLDEFF